LRATGVPLCRETGLRAEFLRMVLTDGGDGNFYDHSDWAGAQVTCS
jgi:hypothetical protein